jgi:hypothetical protein
MATVSTAVNETQKALFFRAFAFALRKQFAAEP